MGQRIWFLLFSSNGQILEGTSISSVPLSSDDLIVQFRDAVKAKFADSLLQGIAPANLKVYENRQAFDSRKSVDEKEKNEPLHPTRTLHGLGTENNALIIEVPSSLPQTPVKLPPVMISVAELVQFWENLRTAVAIDGILAFDPVPSFWGAIPNRLFVRKSYHDIAEIIFEKVKYGEETGTDIGTSGFAITGNPGIGKSVFLFYFMWQLRKKFPEADVVVHRAKDNPFLYVFSNRGCFKTSDYVFVANEFLDKPFTWYLTDTLPNGPSAVSAKTIVVASPARPHYKEFLKYPKTSSLLYLPVWSLEELLLARGIFGLSAATVEERFNLIGGIARFVLEKPESPETTVENVLSRLNMENFTQLIDGSIVGEDRISHLIIHYAVTGNYQKFSLQFASELVLQRALDSFIQNDEAKLCAFLLAGAREPLISSLRGNLFEALANRKIASGGTFNIRSLDDDNAASYHVNLPPRSQIRFKSIEECQNQNSLFIAA